MTPEEFGKTLKQLHFKKTTSVNGAKGYVTTITRDNGQEFGISCFAAPDMKAKKALDCAWDIMLNRLAQEYGYTGDLNRFR